MQEIIPGVYTFTNLIMGRVYLIDDGGDLTLIDAGIKPAGSMILKQIEESGRTLTQVKRILITHAHPDHIGGLYEVANATKAEVIAAAEERPVIQGEIAVPMPDPSTLPGLFRMVKIPASRFKGVPVARIVVDGSVIEGVLGGLQVINVAGHAPGQVAYYQPERKIIFLGDAMMHLFGLRYPLVPATVDMAQAKRSIRRLSEMDIEVACFGHGQPIMNGASEQIRQFARKRGLLS